MSEIANNTGVSASSSNIPSLELSHRGQARDTIPIPVGGLLIGRSAQCDLRLLDPTVSRKHCLIKYRDGRLQVEDLNSLTGTYVNEERVHRSQSLKSADAVRVGSVEFYVQLPSGNDSACRSPFDPLGQESSEQAGEIFTGESATRHTTLSTNDASKREARQWYVDACSAARATSTEMDLRARHRRSRPPE